MNGKIKIKCACALSVGLLHFLASCSSEASPERGVRKTVDLNTYVSSSQASAQFIRESRYLQLSPSWNWPLSVDFPTKASDGDPIRYAPDYGKSRSQGYWYCSWGDYHLNSKGAQKRNALGKIKSVVNLSYYKVNMDAAVKESFEAEISSAERGNDALLSEDIKANCRKGHA